MFHSIRPKIFAVPVRLGKISRNPQTFLTERIENAPYNVRIFVFGIWAVGRSCFVIRLLGVPKAETVMMLGRKNQITKPVFRCERRPLLRIKAHRVKGFVQMKVHIAVLFAAYIFLLKVFS